MSSWGVLFGDVYLGDGYTAQQAMCSYGLPGAISCSDIASTVVQPGYLTLPPDGLGLPELATEDFTRVGYDGVVHGTDYYGPRILTFTAYINPGDPECADCISSREAVDRVITAWRRRWSDEELVLFPLCGPSCDGTHLGRALGFIGRPRVATIVYDEAGGAMLTLRFDCVDQRAYILDGQATPGSGWISKRFDRTDIPQCGQFYNNPQYCVETSDNPEGESILNPGSVEAEPDITFYGAATRPTLINLTNGTMIRFDGAIAAGEMYVYNPADFRLYVDRGAGPIPVSGAKIVGDFVLNPGENRVSLVTEPGRPATGYAVIDYRPSRLTV